MNKKVRNTDPRVFDGIKFRSVTEVKVYQELQRQEIDFEYEPERIVLQPGFKAVNPFFIDSVENTSKVRAMTYTPDFKAKIGPYTVYLEVKGFSTDRYVVKRKLFLNKIKDDDSVIFAEIHTIRGLKNTILKIKKLCEKN